VLEFVKGKKMGWDKVIYYIAAVMVSLLCYLATATGYDFIFLIFGLPVGCWIIWNLSQDEEKPIK